MDSKSEKAKYMKFEFLDPAAIHLSRVTSGAVRMTIDGHDRSYLKVVVARAFPISEPGKYIGFLDGNGKDIGIVEDIQKLDKASRRIVEEELEKRYFMPRIVRIMRLDHEFDVTYFEVQTDRGKRDFTVRGHSENCVEVAPFRYIIEDVDGNRFEIVDIRRLDRRSQDLLANII